MSNLSCIPDTEIGVSPIYRRPKDDVSKYVRFKSSNSSKSNSSQSDSKLDVSAVLDHELIADRPSFNYSVEVSDANNPYLDQSLIRNFAQFGPDGDKQSLAKHTNLGYGSSESKEDALEQKSALVPKENQIEDISTVFRYLKQLGDGASCQVFKVECIKNKKIYAVKKMSKADELNLESFKKERKLLRKMLHPHILQYHDSFVDNDFYYIATCYASGGTMLDKVMKMKSFSECKASEYLVFDRPGKDGKLQIIDFGFSEILDPNTVYMKALGTIHYLPPESRQQRSAEDLKKGDIWSLGVIAYILVFGTPPFGGSSNASIFRRIRTLSLQFRDDDYYTNSCKHFISRLLDKNPAWRFSADEALKHEWIQGNTASHTNLKTVSSSYVESLGAYNGGNKLQHILVNAILNELSLEEQQFLEEGLINMQKANSRCEANNVVDYMVLNSLIQDVPERDEEWKKKRLNDLVQYSNRSLRLDSLEQEYSIQISPQSNANAIVNTPSSSRITDKINNMKSRKSTNNVFNNLVAFMGGALRNRALGGVPESSPSPIPQLSDVPKMSMDSPKESPISPSAGTPSRRHSITMGMSIPCSPLEEDMSEITSPLAMVFKPQMTKPRARRAATESEISDGKISAERLRGIMSQHDKKYPVEKIIGDLQDETGHVPLSAIAKYSANFKTLEEVDRKEVIDNLNE